MGRAFAIALLVTVAAGSAGAGTMRRITPRIEIERPDADARIERARLEITPQREYTRAVLTLWIEGVDERGRDVRTPLRVPHGSRVVEMALTLGDGPRVSAEALDARVAERRYQWIVEGRRDPALLRLEATTKHSDEYSLRAFPVTAQHQARVEVVIELPMTKRLELASTQRIAMVNVFVNEVATSSGPVAEPLAIAVPAAPLHVGPLRFGTAVSKRTSLFAGEPPRPMPPERRREPTLSETLAATPSRFTRNVDVSLPPTGAIAIEVASDGSGEAHSETDAERGVVNAVSRFKVRTVASRNAHAIAACFPTSVAVNDPVAIRFAVLPSGRVAAVSVAGSITDDIKSCIAASVATWAFGEGEELAMANVNVPLQLRSL